MSIKLSFKKGDPPRIYSTPFSLCKRGAKEKNIYNSSKNKLL
jgi:hypothetical protein